MVAIHSYTIYRKDRHAKGGGVAVYIQNHIPVKLIEDLMLNSVEVIWLQIHLPHLKPIIVGNCYKPTSTNSRYLDRICEMLDNICESNRNLYFLGDLNIDWLSTQEKASNSNLCLQPGSGYQSPTMVVTNSTGMKSSTFIGQIFTNVAEICFKVVSKPIGCSDHIIVALSRKTKVPKAGPNIVYEVIQ